MSKDNSKIANHKAIIYNLYIKNHYTYLKSSEKNKYRLVEQVGMSGRKETHINEISQDGVELYFSALHKAKKPELSDLDHYYDGSYWLGREKRFFSLAIKGDEARFFETKGRFQ